MPPASVAVEFEEIQAGSLVWMWLGLGIGTLDVEHRGSQGAST